MTLTVIGVALFYVIFGTAGLSDLPPGSPFSDPSALCLILFGLSSLVMLAAGVQSHLRFQRNAEAIAGLDARVAITTDRLRSILFAVALAFAVPEMIAHALASRHPLSWLIVPGLAYYAVKAFRKALKPETIAIIDAEGIEAREIWLGRIRWQDLEDIRVGRTETSPRLHMRMQCLAFVFRDGLSTPQRTSPSQAFDAHSALGTFLLMPTWLGLSLTNAVRGLNVRLERSRGITQA